MLLLRYLLCLCGESGHALAGLVDAHQFVHCLDRNNNYQCCLWLEHSLSNVHGWACDCTRDAVSDIQENELTTRFEVLCFGSCALQKRGGLS